MADRIAVLRNGRLAQVGTPAELYEHPQTRFVADFIGEMNFLEGVARDHGVEVPGAGVLRGTADKPGGTIIAVRPERVRLSDVATDGNCLLGEVFDTAYHGSDLSVHLRVCDGRHIMVVRAQAGQIDPATITQGAKLYCVWDAEHTRILHATDQ